MGILLSGSTLKKIIGIYKDNKAYFFPCVTIICCLYKSDVSILQTILKMKAGRGKHSQCQHMNTTIANAVMLYTFRLLFVNKNIVQLQQKEL